MPREPPSIDDEALREIPEAPWVVENSAVCASVQNYQTATQSCAEPSGRLRGVDVDCDDEDCGVDDRDTLQYELISDDIGAFTITEDERLTGLLRVSQPDVVDYERYTDIRVVVQVSDKGGLSAQTSVLVKLIDVNESSIPSW